MNDFLNIYLLVLTDCGFYLKYFFLKHSLILFQLGPKLHHPPLLGTESLGVVLVCFVDLESSNLPVASQRSRKILNLDIPPEHSRKDFPCCGYFLSHNSQC